MGTLYIAIFFYFYVFLSWMAGPILWVGYPFVALIFYTTPQEWVKNLFLAWFFDMELHYAFYESLFTSLPLGASTLGKDTWVWNLFWYGLWYPLWWALTGLFYLLSVPIFTGMGFVQVWTIIFGSN